MGLPIDETVLRPGPDPEAHRADNAQTERRFRKIMDASQELVSLIRPDGDWILSTLGGPLGFPTGHMPPAGILSLVHPDDYDLAEAALDALTAAEPSGGNMGTLVVRIRTIDGRYLWMENTGVNLLEDPDVGALVLYSRDVTERLEAEREVAEANVRLEELSSQLRAQNQSLLELDRLKSELVATVSHELRTPLTSIISFAELLIDDPEMTEADRAQFTRIISNNANRLLVVVGDLLLLGGAEAGTLQIDPLPVDVPSVVDDAVAALEPAADTAGINMRTEHTPGPVLDADAARLEQVVSNLVMNAIKFTPAGGEIVASSAYDAGCWTITVRDTGIGIPIEEQAAIFDRFVRASNATSATGTGLGLAVVRSLVTLHGGEVALHSEPGSGTTVTVTLPLGEPMTVVEP